mmetsp:Transcript_10239/g.29099  ORF Transcript_10239/g.29099 Transcript_10239/m.29099 type:complete len:255 (-) Transcript_10239:145-909(-)
MLPCHARVVSFAAAGGSARRGGPAARRVGPRRARRHGGLVGHGGRVGAPRGGVPRGAVGARADRPGDARGRRQRLQRSGPHSQRPAARPRVRARRGGRRLRSALQQRHRHVVAAFGEALVADGRGAAAVGHPGALYLLRPEGAAGRGDHVAPGLPGGCPRRLRREPLRAAARRQPGAAGAEGADAGDLGRDRGRHGRPPLQRHRVVGQGVPAPRGGVGGRGVRERAAGPRGVCAILRGERGVQRLGGGAQFRQP